MSLLLLDTAESGLFPPEQGALRIAGTHFYNGQALAQLRGYSWFLGFLRYCRGENIGPDLRWMRAFGFNCPRVFGPLPWAETPDYRIEQFDFEKFYSFCTLLASQGLRVNFSVGHYPSVQWRWFDRQIDDIARQLWNLTKERVNEPHVGPKPDPVMDFPPVAERKTLTSYGYYKQYYNNAPGLDPLLDFGTIHIQRDSAWHRKARHAQELQSFTGKPWWSDEPAKLTEPGFSYPGGKNDPLKTPSEIVWHAGVCYLWTSVFTFHCEEGKWGRVPTPGMLQHTCAEAVRDQVFLKIGPEWQTGEYNRGGNGDSPVDNAFTEQNQIWTYTSLHAHKALSVRCGNIPLKAINGWRIADSWANGTLAWLER
jgi:hypothetical protein